MESPVVPHLDVDEPRSLLFLPGSRPELVTKALRTATDAIIVDLEDAVAVDHKVAARDSLGETLAPALGSRTIYVRVNAYGTPWFDADVRAAALARADGVIVPKVESVEECDAIEARLRDAERANGGNRRRSELVFIVESARGLFASPGFTVAPERVQRLAFGAYDFALDADLIRSSEGFELLFARSWVAIAAHAMNVQAIDSPYADIKDVAGLRRDAARGRSLGYTGKFCIHPSQIDIVNEVFAPSAEQLDRAVQIIAAFEKAEAEGRAVLTVDGAMVDAPVVERARRLFSRASRLGLI